MTIMTILNVRSDCLIYSDTVAHNTSYFLISLQAILLSYKHIT